MNQKLNYKQKTMVRFSWSKFTNSTDKRVIYFLDCLGISNEQDDRKSDGIEMTEMGELDIEFGF